VHFQQHGSSTSCFIDTIQSQRCNAAAAAAAAVQVQVLRNYLGTALIHAYELRHLTLRRLLVSSTAGAAGSSSGMLDLDAELYLQAYCRSVMLEWVDALWSCFLEVRGLIG
jgi:tetrahydromethanopterin S-methyltransferase subunit E